MPEPTLAFIGGGNMAQSLIGGLLAGGWELERVRVSDPDAAQREALDRRWPGMAVCRDNSDAAGHAEIVMLVVKPQAMRAAAESIAAKVAENNPLVISIAAGIRTADLARWLGGDPALVRCMPNTPALVKCGATALYANTQVSAEQRAIAGRILGAVGMTLWLDDEVLLDAVTAVSGSGPAYFLLVMEAMQAAGRDLGLPAETARRLTLQTALGAATLALQSDDEPARLRARVTSKGGTTEAAIAELERGGLRQQFKAALRAAARRSAELADEFGKDKDQAKDQA